MRWDWPSIPVLLRSSPSGLPSPSGDSHTDVWLGNRNAFVQRMLLHLNTTRTSCLPRTLWLTHDLLLLDERPGVYEMDTDSPWSRGNDIFSRWSPSTAKHQHLLASGSNLISQPHFLLFGLSSFLPHQACPTNSLSLLFQQHLTFPHCNSLKLFNLPSPYVRLFLCT